MPSVYVKVQSRSANPRFPTLNLTRGKTPLLLLPLPSVCLPVKRQSIRVLARTALIVPCISRGHGPHLAQLPADVSTFQLAFSFFDFGVRKFETATRRPLPVPYTTPSGKVKIIESINIKIKTVVTFPDIMVYLARIIQRPRDWVMLGPLLQRIDSVDFNTFDSSRRHHSDLSLF